MAYTHINYVFSLLLRLIKVWIGFCNNLCACIHASFLLICFAYLVTEKSMEKPLDKKKHLVATQTRVNRKRNG
jgi:hypothetical protein